jgi:hypothetical protein
VLTAMPDRTARSFCLEPPRRTEADLAQTALKTGNINLSEEADIHDEVELAARALEAMVAAHLAAGRNRCVLAAACVWGGVKEMSEVTSSESAAAALRTIANQIDPPVDVPRSKITARSDDALMVAVREHGRHERSLKKRASEDFAADTFNQEIAGDVVGEAIDLLDQGQPVLARALLMALRARIVGSSRQPMAVAKRRWGA